MDKNACPVVVPEYVWKQLARIRSLRFCQPGFQQAVTDFLVRSLPICSNSSITSLQTGEGWSVSNRGPRSSRCKFWCGRLSCYYGRNAQDGRNGWWTQAQDMLRCRFKVEASVGMDCAASEPVECPKSKARMTIQ